MEIIPKLQNYYKFSLKITFKAIGIDNVHIFLHKLSLIILINKINTALNINKERIKNL